MNFNVEKMHCSEDDITIIGRKLNAVNLTINIFVKVKNKNKYIVGEKICGLYRNVRLPIIRLCIIKENIDSTSIHLQTDGTNYKLAEN